MAEHIKVTLEHHFNRGYHAIKHGPGRRPAAVTYGNFNLRYRDPQLGGKRVRVTLEVSGLTAALEARSGALPSVYTPHPFGGVLRTDGILLHSYPGGYAFYSHTLRLT